MSVSIQTSQNVRLDYEPASIGDRIVATLIDYLVFFGWLLLTLAIPAAFNVPLGTYYVIIVTYIPILLYDLVCEWLLNGQTPGKIATNIRVVMLDGGQPGLGAYLLRWLFRLVDTKLIGPLVAIVAVAANSRGQRLGDLAAGTTVVKLSRPISLDQIEYQALPDNYVVQFPEVRQLSDRDLSIVREVLRRSDETAIIRTADKIRAVTTIQTSLSSRAFLETVVSDYQYLATQ